MIEIKYRALIETISLEYDYNKDVQDKDAEFQTDEVGLSPLLYIDGVQVENQNIISMKINNDSMFPTVEIEFTDPTSHLLMEQYPVDNTILSIYKKSTSSGLMDIKMDFKILTFQTNNGTTGTQVTIKITGVLNIDDMYLLKYESYEGSSYNVFDTLSTDMLLGYATNIDTTNDDMVWINPGDYRQNFIREIIKKSYIDDTTFLFGYVDFYYNFNYIDINKQINSDISTQNNIDDTESLGGELSEDPIPTPLIITNNEDKASSNLYILKYTVNHDSTKVNIDTGYRYRYIAYNKTDNQTKSYFLDSITGDNDNSIVLKGNPYSTNDILYNESIKDVWEGKIDTYNVHENFLHTELQNKNNLKYLQKLKMTIKMSKPNYGLYRFQKVLIELYNLGKMNDSEENDGEKPEGTDQGQYDSKIIHRLSGEWLITAINFSFTRDEGNIQEITVIKRELTEEYNFPRREKKENK